MGLAAFAIAITAGLWTHNPPQRVLLTAIASMIICRFIGLAIGAISQRVVSEHAHAYIRANPVPDLPAGTLSPDMDVSGIQLPPGPGVRG